jgi:putative FmdB family regulatory protein
MPTYGYECLTCKEQFEITQKMTEPALTTHENCGGDLRRLLYPVGIVFKGSGFYVNDYAKPGKKDAAESGSAAKSTDTASDTKSDTKADTASESKTETKTETKSETKSDTKSDPPKPSSDK